MAENKLRIGDPLPHFILNDENHQPVNISSIKGKYLVLYFYPKDDTPGCIKEACSFRDSIEELMELGALVYGVSSDKPGYHANFKAKYHRPFSLLSDNSDEFRKLLGVPADLFGLIPGRVTYVFNPDGRLIEMFKSQLSPKKHVQEALKVIKEYQNNKVPKYLSA